MEDLHHKQGNQQVYGYQANADAGQVSPAPARHTATIIIKFIVIHITLVALSPASGTRKTSALNLWRWMAAGCHNETGSLNPFGYEKTRRGGSYGSLISNWTVKPAAITSGISSSSVF
ncbi:TPA: hypothetical protein ACJVFL_002483 [Klebsiella aerogenes]